MAKIEGYDQTVYLLQGGGALGAFQLGVCTALMEHGYEPDWIVGTSIGAINGAIIAGNKPEDRIAKLKGFWQRIATPLPSASFDSYGLEILRKQFSANWTLCYGQQGFFRPRMWNPLLNTVELTPDKISFYDTSELYETLEEFVNFNLINQKKVRLSLGATSVESGIFQLFDNTKQTIGPEHVMASGALPPGFPAVKIEDQYYWDGGIVINTPLHTVLMEPSSQKYLCFVVNLFSPEEEHLPHNLLDVLSRKKDIEFASRHRRFLQVFSELHHLKHYLHRAMQVIKQLDKKPELPFFKDLERAEAPKYLKLVLLHYRGHSSDLESLDYEFSAQTVREHEKEGYILTNDALKQSKTTAPLVGDQAFELIEF